MNFVMSIKPKRAFASSENDKKEDRFVRADSVEMEPGMIRTAYMKGFLWFLKMKQRKIKHQLNYFALGSKSFTEFFYEAAN